ncbi:MAG: alpha/beta hydrolase [Parcubacteria group bacterium]|nr:alpha/beta hydrolase [Parcubacteria group bacterium]
MEEILKEQNLQLQDIQVHYKEAGQGDALLILHGWGASSESWVLLQRALSKEGFRVIAIDLPGFGRSNPPATVWGVQDYSNFIEQFVRAIGIRQFFLLGHSFGGQIAISFSVQHQELVKKLILCAPAGIRRPLGAREKLLFVFSKILALALLVVPSQSLKNRFRAAAYRLMRRSDYFKAEGVMSEVMRRVIREDLFSIFSQVRVPTLIVWGDDDRMVPVEDAYVLAREIPHSAVEIIPGAGHSPHLKTPEKLSELVTKFLKS